MKKAAISLMALSIIMKIMGFFREIVLSYFYGASYVSDAYLISLTIPGTIFAFVGTGIITSFIPMYNKIEKEEGLDSAETFTSNVINHVLILCIIIVGFVMLYADFFVKIFASGFEGKVLDLAILFTRITSMEIVFIAIIYIFTGYLNNKNKFLTPVLISLPFNISIIASIILSTRLSLIALPIGSVVATILQFIFLLIFMIKQKFKHSIVLDIKNPKIKQMLILSIPVIIGVSVNQINVLVDRTIASQITTGGISALNYSSRLNGFVQGIFISSIVTILYPKISRLAGDKKKIDEFKNVIADSIIMVIILVMPITIGAMFFSEEIIIFLFGRGAFDQLAVKLTSTTLFYYSIGMIGFGLREILSRAFYSMHDTKTPMVNASIGVLLNIFLNILFSYYIGLGGLALATSLSAIGTSILMFVSLRKKIGGFSIRKVIIIFIKILTSSVLMGIIARFSYNNVINYFSQNSSLLISFLIGTIIYFIIIFFMKIEDIDEVFKDIKNKIGRDIE